MTISFVDLAAQQARIGGQLRARMDAVLAHGRYVLGPEVDELEGALAERVGVSDAVTCSSGTDALLLSLLAFEIGPGDAVFTTPFTFIATAEAIARTGARPVFVDVLPDTFNIDPVRLESAVRSAAAAGGLRPRAVVAVDLFGLPADYPAIADIADAAGLIVVEDAAQSFGAACGERRAGAFGSVGATSFFPAKPLGCYGDGGAVFTDDAEVARTLRSLRVHGQGRSKYENLRLGINGRLDTIQAAVLLAKLTVFTEELAARNRVAEHYRGQLQRAVGMQHIPRGFRSAWAQMSILLDDRDGVRERLEKSGIPTAVYYPVPLHLLPAFSWLQHRVGDFPVAEGLSRRILSLPMHPYLALDDVDFICEQVMRAARAGHDDAQGRAG